MKRFAALFIIAMNCFLQLLSQEGSGTMGDPYWGTLTGDRTWSGDQIYADEIIIPAGFTLTVTPSENGTLLVMDGVEIDGTFIIHPRVSVTVDVIINDGTMLLESYQNEGGVASLLIQTDYSGTGITIFRLYLSGGTAPGGYHRWHYISMSVNGVAVSSFSTLDFARYVESLVFKNLLTDIPGLEHIAGRPRVYYTPGKINIVSEGDLFNNLPASITVYDLSGRKLFTQNRLDLMENGHLTQLIWDYPSAGVYLVEIRTEGNRFVGLHV